MQNGFAIRINGANDEYLRMVRFVNSQPLDIRTIMRVAIIDLGTNTFHLLIADVFTDNSYKKVFVTRAVVKLGKGGIGRNIIADFAFKKGVKTISHFNDLIKEHKAQKVFAFATSAIRSAKNKNEFIKAIEDKTGIRIKVIDGNEEATLIYLGVKQCVDLDNKPSLIIDIGGGSTEFIIADKKKIYWKHSFNIGASRLLEKFNPSDPITSGEIKMLEEYFDNTLQPLKPAIKKYPVARLVGSSGSFDTLAEVIGYKFHGRNPIKNSNTYKFDLSEYKAIHEQLLKSTTAQRKKMKGLISMRVDMIVVASICINYIMNQFRLRGMVVSKYALKEGALWQVIHS